jgi:hypothetical protein
MILDPYIQKLIRERLGCELSRPSEFDALALDIETATGEHIGVNTLKRLFGLLSEVSPTETTLNIVALYLGYGSWRLLKKVVDDKNSVIDEESSGVYPTDLPWGTRIVVFYEPHRKVSVVVDDDGLCRVEEISGGKLRVGDRLDVPAIFPERPFHAKRLLRDDQDLGSYTGGIEGGVTTVWVEEQKVPD